MSFFINHKEKHNFIVLEPSWPRCFLFKSCFLTGTMSSCQWQHLQWWCKSWTGYLLHLVTTSWFLLFPEVVQTGQYRYLQKSVGRDVQRDAVLKASIAYKGLYNPSWLEIPIWHESRWCAKSVFLNICCFSGAQHTFLKKE